MRSLIFILNMRIMDLEIPHVLGNVRGHVSVPQDCVVVARRFCLIQKIIIDNVEHVIVADGLM